MPFLRLTRDHRGYENTFLLHVNHLGERPRILYWYRSAPGVRVGRPALDEDAIRAIEEQHPDIEFDWPHIFAVGAAMTPEIEPKPERPPRPVRPQDERGAGRPRRKAAPAQDEDVDAPPPEAASSEPDAAPAAELEPIVEPAPEPPHEAASARLELLDELVGREIATRLRMRYGEIRARLEAVPDATLRNTWQSRVEAFNPDAWSTPEEILRGVQQADKLFDEFRRAFKSDY